MTIYRSSEFIPGNDIKIKTKYMVKEMYNIFDNYIDDLVDDKQKTLVNNLYKIFKKNIRNRYFWYKISSNKFCCYEYTGLNEYNLARICNRRIDTKHDENDPDKYFCAEHNRNHRKNKSKSIKINEENRCSIIKKDGKQCKYNSRINSICCKHYKWKYNIDNIHNVYNIIEEINILNNIDYDFVEQIF